MQLVNQAVVYKEPRMKAIIEGIAVCQTIESYIDHT